MTHLLLPLLLAAKVLVPCKEAEEGLYYQEPQGDVVAHLGAADRTRGWPDLKELTWSCQDEGKVRQLDVFVEPDPKEYWTVLFWRVRYHPEGIVHGDGT